MRRSIRTAVALIGLSLAAGSLPATAQTRADGSDSQALEREVQDLRRRVAELDRRTGALTHLMELLLSTGSYVPPPPAAWGRISQGMSRAEVARILGHPFSFTIDLVETWYYAPGKPACAWVQFDADGLVTTFCQPGA